MFDNKKRQPTIREKATRIIGNDWQKMDYKPSSHENDCDGKCGHCDFASEKGCKFDIVNGVNNNEFILMLIANFYRNN